MKSSSPAQTTHSISQISYDTDLPKLIFLYTSASQGHSASRMQLVPHTKWYHTCWSIQEVQWDLSRMQEVYVTLFSSGTATTIYSLIPQPYRSSKHLHLLHNKCMVLFALSLIFSTLVNCTSSSYLNPVHLTFPSGLLLSHFNHMTQPLQPSPPQHPPQIWNFIQFLASSDTTTTAHVPLNSLCVQNLLQRMHAFQQQYYICK